MYILNYVEHHFLVISTFFDSAIKKVNTASNNLNALLIFIINMLFNICFSVVVGGIVSFFFSVLLILTKNQHVVPNATILMSMPLVFFTLLSSIILLNFKTNYFSLPWLIYIFYGIFLVVEPKKHFIQTLLFLITVPFILTLILIAPVSFIFQNQEENPIVMILVIFSFAFITTILLYSYGTLDTLSRIRRQFILWFIILIGVLFVSSIQLKINLSEPISSNIHLGSILLVFSFIYSMITVIDKGTELFKLLFNNYSSDMEKIWREYTSRYGVNVFKYKFIQNILKLFLLIKLTKFSHQLHNARNIGKFSLRILSYISLLTFGFYLIYSKIIFNFIFSLNSEINKYLFSNEKQISDIIFLFISTLIFVWSSFSIRDLKKSDWSMREQIFGKLLISVILISSALLNTGFEFAIIILKFSFIALSILIVVVVIMRWLYKLIYWIKS